LHEVEQLLPKDEDITKSEENKTSVFELTKQLLSKYEKYIPENKEIKKLVDEIREKKLLESILNGNLSKDSDKRRILDCMFESRELGNICKKLLTDNLKRAEIENTGPVEGLDLSFLLSTGEEEPPPPPPPPSPPPGPPPALSKDQIEAFYSAYPPPKGEPPSYEKAMKDATGQKTQEMRVRAALTQNLSQLTENVFNEWNERNTHPTHSTLKREMLELIAEGHSTDSRILESQENLILQKIVAYVLLKESTESSVQTAGGINPAIIKNVAIQMVNRKIETPTDAMRPVLIDGLGIKINRDSRFQWIRMTDWHLKENSRDFFRFLKLFGIIVLDIKRQKKKKKRALTDDEKKRLRKEEQLILEELPEIDRRMSRQKVGVGGNNKRINKKTKNKRRNSKRSNSKRSNSKLSNSKLSNSKRKNSKRTKNKRRNSKRRISKRSKNIDKRRNSKRSNSKRTNDNKRSKNIDKRRSKRSNKRPQINIILEK
jgi:hypothetical protein